MGFRDLLRFRHCTRTIFTLSDPVGPTGLWCPVCCQAVRFSLSEAPVRIQTPITDGHRAACSFLITSQLGEAGFSEENESELHVGISSSKGVVFSYTEWGVVREQEGWEQSVIVPLVAPSHDTLRFRMLWDRQLETFSNQDTWTGDRFQEQREFGSCCYGFALSYINHVMRSEGSDPIVSENFTSRYILPRMKAASNYLSMYQDICEHGYYVVHEQSTVQC